VHFFSKENANNVNLKQHEGTNRFLHECEKDDDDDGSRQTAVDDASAVDGKVFALSRRFARLVDKAPAGWCASSS